MIRAARDYLNELIDDFGTSWNRFWYTPRGAETLSVIRVLLGCFTLYWLATFTPDLDRFFGPSGMLSPWRLVLLADVPESNVSYFNVLSTPGAVMAGHVVGIIVVALFTIGTATRVTSILATLVVLSYIDRTWVMATSFEAVLAMLMIYMCIGRSGDHLSFDAWWRRRRADEDTTSGPGQTVWTNLATRLMQVHLTVIYFIMAVAKLRSSEWWDGQAMGWLWARPGESSLVDLSFLMEFPYAFNLVTLGILAFELAFVFLVWQARTRPLALGVSAAVWLLLAITTGLSAFCLLMMVANLVFVSPAALRSAGGQLFDTNSARTVSS